MTRRQLIEMISASANMMTERDDIIDYINSLPTGETIDVKDIRDGYQRFKDEKNSYAMAALASKHGLEQHTLQVFVDRILDRMIFDGEQLTDLMAPQELSWKQRSQKELALMEELVPLLKKRAEGHEISGLSAYE